MATTRRRPAVRPRDERGAVVLVAALAMTLLLIVAALVADIGLQRVARSDMQAVADVVALDLSRELDGRTAAVLEPLMPALAAQSRARNATSVGAQAVVTPTLGKLDDTGGFVPVSGGTPPSAVRVVASTDVPFAFAGVTGADSGSASRSAVATSSAGACLKVGSYAARLDAAQSALLNPVLSGLLGSAVDLDLVSYNGLAASSITLLELVRVGGLGVGTVDELLALPGLEVGSLIVATANVLQSQGKTSEAAVLRRLSVSAATPTIRVANLIQAAPSEASALTAQFNVLDLLVGSAQVANRSTAIAIPDLGITLGGLRVGATLSVIEGPVTACGGAGTVARTSQVRLEIPVSVPGRTVNIAGLGTVTIAPTTLTMRVDLGRAEARLASVACAAGGPTSLDVSVASSVVGGVSVIGSVGVKGTDIGVLTGTDLLSVLLNSLGLRLTDLLSAPSLSFDTSLTVGSSTASVPFSGQLTLPLPGSYTTPVGASSGIVLTPLSSTTTASAGLAITYRPLLPLGGPTRTTAVVSGDPLFNSVLGLVDGYLLTTVLNPILADLQTTVVGPLSDLLGLRIAGADVFAVPTPNCSSPVLRG